MTWAMLFWILMLLWLCFGGWISRPGFAGGGYWSFAGYVFFPIALIAILGLHVFGAPVH